MTGQIAQPRGGDWDPLDEARKLVPSVVAQADEANRNRCLPQQLARDIAKAGLHKLSSPLHANGSESNPLTQIRAIEILSEADGSTGWNLMIGLEVQGFVAAAFPPDRALELFGGPEIIICGALNPVGRAIAVDGGLRISGVWPMASGCQNADYFWGQCIVTDADGEFLRNEKGAVRLREVLVPPADMEILDTWDTSGICGSGSHDIAADDLFVPDDMITAVTERMPFVDSPLFRIPANTRLAYNKFAVASGIARGALTHFKTLASEKKPRSSRALLCERGDAQRAIAEAEALQRSARAFVFEAVGEVWETVLAGKRPTNEAKALVQLACTGGVQSDCKAVDILCASAGVNVVYGDSLLGRCQRDIHVVPQHITVSPQWTEAVGRVLLGLASDVPLL